MTALVFLSMWFIWTVWHGHAQWNSDCRGSHNQSCVCGGGGDNSIFHITMCWYICFNFTVPHGHDLTPVKPWLPRKPSPEPCWMITFSISRWVPFHLFMLQSTNKILIHWAISESWILTFEFELQCNFSKLALILSGILSIKDIIFCPFN